MMNFTGLNFVSETTGYLIDNNSLSDLLVSGAIFGAFLLILFLLRWITVNKVKTLIKDTKNDFDDLILEFLEEIHWPFIFFLAFFAGAKYLVLTDILDDVIQYMLVLFSVFYVLKGLGKVIDYFTFKQVKKKSDQDSSLLILMNKGAKAILWIIAFVLLLANLGLNVTSLIAGIGVGGIAIAFALQKVLEDIFSAFSIYFDKPFEVGDYVVIGEDSGTVERIGLKTTRIRDLKGDQLVVSNRELTTIRIHNYKRMKERRVVFAFGIEYSTPTKKMEKIPSIVEGIIGPIENARFDRTHFKNFGDFSLNYEVVYYVDSSDYLEYMNIQQEINLALKRMFEKEKIEFAFPTQTIFVKK